MPAHASMWIPDARAPSFAPMSGDVVIDMVVVGAGPAVLDSPQFDVTVEVR
jgi:hypothetical protein